MGRDRGVGEKPSSCCSRLTHLQGEGGGLGLRLLDGALPAAAVRPFWSPPHRRRPTTPGSLWATTFGGERPPSASLTVRSKWRVQHGPTWGSLKRPRRSVGVSTREWQEMRVGVGGNVTRTRGRTAPPGLIEFTLFQWLQASPRRIIRGQVWLGPLAGPMWTVGAQPGLEGVGKEGGPSGGSAGAHWWAILHIMAQLTGTGPSGPWGRHEAGRAPRKRTSVVPCKIWKWRINPSLCEMIGGVSGKRGVPGTRLFKPVTGGANCS